MLGKLIKEAREKQGISQSKLGELIGKTQSDISKYENGTMIIPNEVLPDIANHLHIPQGKIKETLWESIVYNSYSYLSDVSFAKYQDIFDDLVERYNAEIDKWDSHYQEFKKEYFEKVNFIAKLVEQNNITTFDKAVDYILYDLSEMVNKTSEGILKSFDIFVCLSLLYKNDEETIKVISEFMSFFEHCFAKDEVFSAHQKIIEHSCLITDDMLFYNKSFLFKYNPRNLKNFINCLDLELSFYKTHQDLKISDKNKNMFYTFFLLSFIIQKKHNVIHDFKIFVNIYLSSLDMLDVILGTLHGNRTLIEEIVNDILKYDVCTEIGLKQQVEKKDYEFYLNLYDYLEHYIIARYIGE